MPLFYLLSLIVIIVGFTLYPLISKKYIKGVGYQKFVPLFLAFSAIGTSLVAFIVYRQISINLLYLPLLALLGAMYTIAAYLFFYSIENENISILNSIVGTQDVLIALFSGIFFFSYEIKAVLLPFLIVILGIILVAYKSSGNLRFSKYVLFTLICVLFWVFIWVYFYTINTKFPILYYMILQTFAFVFCIPVALLQNKKEGIKYYLQDKKSKYIIAAGLLNGVATAVFSYSYKFNGLLTPFVAQLCVPFVIILSIIFLMERPKKIETLGLIALVVGPILYILLQ